MRYFIDTEFHEGFHKPSFGRKRHFIDLISIGIVSEDNREYYAISKDFDIKAAWRAYEWESMSNLGGIGDTPSGKKVYWLRDNVLRPIFEELHRKFVREDDYKGSVDMKFEYSNFKYLIAKYGKSNNQIKQGIINFICSYQEASEMSGIGSLDFGYEMYLGKYPPEFYGYYADYDWVVFCSLFGKMIDLPEGFPMYCKDLKQILDGKANNEKLKDVDKTLDWLKYIKFLPNYPKQTNEHNSLSDAHWNKELYHFLNSI